MSCFSAPLLSPPSVPRSPTPPKTIAGGGDLSPAAATRRVLLLSAVALISSPAASPLFPSPSSASPVAIADFFEIPGSGGVKALDLRAGAGDSPAVGDQVISGIESAVKSMKVGGILRVIIPPSQGYQNTSQEPLPPNVFDRQRLFTTIFNPTRLANGEGSTLGTLIFDIELVWINHH